MGKFTIGVVGERYIWPTNNPPQPETNRVWRFIKNYPGGYSEYTYDVSDWRKEPQEPIRVVPTETEMIKNLRESNHSLREALSKAEEINDCLKGAYEFALDTANKRIDTFREEKHCDQCFEKNHEERIACLTRANENQANTIDKLQAGNKEFENQLKEERRRNSNLHGVIHTLEKKLTDIIGIAHGR